MRLTLAVLIFVAFAGTGCKRKPPASCPELGAHVVRLFAPADDYARDVGAVFATQCAEDGWSVEMRTCLAATRALTEPRSCGLKLTPAQREKLDAKLAEADRKQRARVLPDACLRYQRVVERLMACDKVPAEARTSLKDKLEAAKRDWPGLPDKQILEPVCSSAIQATQAAFGPDCPGAW